MRLKHDLKRKIDWSNMRAFQTIDNRGEGFLNYNNIMNFCRMNSFRASESEVIAIVRRLDIDADQRITFNEWNDLMEDKPDLVPAVHANPCSDDREDPYFRHTSPAKTYQRRSPRHVASPRTLHKPEFLANAAENARFTREEYESRARESPLRSSP